MKHTSTFTSAVIVGQRVTGVSIGATRTGRVKYRTEWSGIYEGVRPSEWDDHEPVHFFRDGEIGGTPQRCFATPVDKFTDGPVR